MTSYWSELGGIAAGLGVIGTLMKSGLIIIRAVTLICDNSEAVLSSKQDLTPSVFHRTESPPSSIWRKSGAEILMYYIRGLRATRTAWINH
jgi:hypothetical protein